MKFILLLLLSMPAMAQTLTLNDSSVVVASPYKTGVNIAGQETYDSGQILKNLVGGQNQSFEPILNQSIWVQPAGTGATNSFTIPDPYISLVVTNVMAGATYNIVESSTAAKGCTGTVTASNTASPPVVTLGTPCAVAISEGDQIVFSQTLLPTAESVLETGGSNSVSSGGKITADTVTPYVGQQSLILNTTPASASASVGFFFNDGGSDNFVIFNGTYSFSFAYKLVSGTASYSTAINRAGGTGFACSHTDTPTSASWTRITITCTGTETASTPVGTMALFVTQTGAGITEIDDFQFTKTSGQNPANTSIYRDEWVQSIEDTCGGITGPLCPIRNWLDQNAETMDNWILPANQAAIGYAGPLTSYNTGNTPRLQDYLNLVKLVNGSPYLEVPITITPTDAQHLIDFLSSTNTSSGYGQKRAALGQTAPWCGATGVFTLCHLTFANEAWNGVFVGQSLGFRGGTALDLYTDYAQREGTIYAAIHTDSNYTATAIQLGFDLQMGQVDHLSDEWTAMGVRGGAPDYGETAPYTQGNLSNWQTDAALWGAAMEEPYDNIANTSSVNGYNQQNTLVRSFNLCGPAATTACYMNSYEFGNGTLSTCGVAGNPACGAPGSSNVSIDQTHMSYINEGGGRGIIDPLQSLLMIKSGFAQFNTIFGSTGYGNGTLVPGLTALLWGNFVDAGGTLSALDGASYRARPTLLGVRIANAATIGAMTNCTLTSGPTYNFPGDPVNGPQGALNNVPYLYQFCFKDGAGNRSIVIVNTNLTTGYTVTLAGATLPTGTVNVTQFVPTTIDSMNETVAGTNTNTAPLVLSNATSTVSAPTTLTIPAKSITSYKYAVTVTPVVIESITGAATIRGATVTH